MKLVPILIDTDPGVDDFFCIAIGCAFRELFDLKAITTIGGNNTTEVTTQNALNILKLLHRDDVPVAKGADSFLTRSFGRPVAKFHGANGLGNVELEKSENDPVPLSACDMIYKTATECNGDLVVVTVGPETNLALALNKYPDLKTLIKKIVVMGGTTTTGNISPYAEANIYNDAEAAKTVFANGIPIDMVGLNVTRLAPLRKSIFNTVSPAVRPEVRNVIEKLIEFRNEEAMHDAIAISSLVCDDVITWKNSYTYVIDGDSERRGVTVTDFDAITCNSRIAVAIDTSAYYRVITDMINNYC